MVLALQISMSTPAWAQSTLPPDAQAEVLFQKARSILGRTTIAERDRLKQAYAVFRDYEKLPEHVKTLPALAIDAEVAFQLGDYSLAKSLSGDFLKRSNAATPDRGRIALLYAEAEPLAATQRQADDLAVERCNSKHGKDQVIPGCTHIIDVAWRWRSSVAPAWRIRAMARPSNDIERLRDLEAAAKIEPPDAHAIYLLGVTRLDFVKTKGAVQQSIADVERAMKIKGKRDSAYLYQLAAELFYNRSIDEDNLNKALSYINESIALSGTDAAWSRRSLRALIARARGDHDQSIADYNHLLQTNLKPGTANFGTTLLNLATSQILVGDMDAMRKTMERYRIETASAVDPEAAKRDRPAAPMARIYEVAEKYEEAEQEYAKAYTDAQSPNQILLIAANACMMHSRWAKQPERGLVYCNDVLTRRPTTNLLRPWRGMLHAKLGNWPAALADYEQGLKALPSNSAARYGRGLALTKMGRIAQGRADIIAALAADPNVAEYYRRVGLQQ